MRVENIKGAVWTVDENEFCKRRLTRGAEKGNNHNESSSSYGYEYFKEKLFSEMKIWEILDIIHLLVYQLVKIKHYIPIHLVWKMIIKILK